MPRPLAVTIVLLLAACDKPVEGGQNYFERRILPIFTASCNGTSACHRDDGRGVALGNLDLSSFASVQKRRDVLTRHGSYQEPLLLIKAVASTDLFVPYRDGFAPLEIGHGGGAVLVPGGAAYLELATWLQNGATEDGLPPPVDTRPGSGACVTELPAGFDPAAVDPADPAFAAFAPVGDYLVASCGAGSCHGAAAADYRLTCGTDDAQRRANFWMTRAYVAPITADSELLNRPLDPREGGDSHGGGVVWASRDDASYRLVSDWAELAGPLPRPPLGVARQFFEDQVMPVLLRRGCAMQACHSPALLHKLKLRAGSTGFFSPIALDHNYQEARGFLALESPDARAGRLIRKNLLPWRGGIAHRAGAVLETAGAGDCPPVWEAATAAPLCTLAEWRRLERAELPAAELADLSAGATVPLVYVTRPPDAARVVDFADFRPGADLVRAEAVIGSAGAVASASGRTSLISGCPGVGATRADVDVRGPEISYDGLRVLFALRVGAAGGLDVFEVGVDGAGCRRVTSDGGSVANGLTVHNFDPLYVVDDAGVEWVVYASTRGGAGGPRRTPKLFLPDADLWREPLSGGVPERMTVLRGLEAQPQIMSDGQLILLAEKQSADFYQLAGRRLNWDLSDYHPLLGQRRENYQGRGGYLPGGAPGDAVVRPSIGYGQSVEIREALDGNFLVVLADGNALAQGGALGIFNRSLGPFEQGRSDPEVVPSLTVLPGPTGRAGVAAGAYRSPFPLPDGTILASYAAGVDVAAQAPVAWDLVVVDPVTGDRRVLIADAEAEVEAVLAYARPAPRPFTIRPLIAGATADTALVHFPDLPLLATILDSNNRRGRAVDDLRGATRVRFFLHEAPPVACLTSADPACAGALVGPEAVYEQRVELGAAAIAADGSAFVRVPALRPFYLELVDDAGTVLFRQREEFQLGPYEAIGIGAPAGSFDSMCAGCHGTISGRELDVHVDIDALTAASTTEARAAGPIDLGP